MLPKNNILWSLFFLSFAGFSQLVTPEQKELLKEFTLGFNTNTNGALVSGFNCRYTYQFKPKNYRLFYFEAVNVKHEREQRFTTNTNSSFIVGKTQFLFALRPAYGREITLFNKYPENGVRLNFCYAGGPTIGLVKPYMIEYIVGKNSQGQDLIDIVPYNPSIHSITLINGDAGMFNSMYRSKLNVGAHLRTSMNFEYGPAPYLLIGLETGATFEAYTKKNILLVNNEARRLYSAFFVHLYYGLSF